MPALSGGMPDFDARNPIVPDYDGRQLAEHGARIGRLEKSEEQFDEKLMLLRDHTDGRIKEVIDKIEGNTRWSIGILFALVSAAIALLRALQKH